MFKTSLFMGSLTFKHVTYFGFYLGGITTALFTLGMVVLYRRYCGLHPEVLHKEVLRRISKAPVVVEKFGTSASDCHSRGFSVLSRSEVTHHLHLLSTGGELSNGQFKAYSSTGA